MSDTVHGQVIRSQSGFFTVQTDSKTLTCKLRGRLMKGRRLGDVVAVGDRVRVAPLESGRGMIEGVEPRERMFSRLAPRPQGEYQQILIANLDQAVLVFACARPEPHFGMLDRFLVIAEKQSVPALIVANKIDLVGMPAAEASFERYSAVGYPVVFTSVYSQTGIQTFKDRLKDKLSWFAGPSGAGKTSLLNAIQPGLGLAVRQVSAATSKGRHTTVVRQLFPLDEGGYVADTPGLKALALWDIEPEELDGYFPELRQLIDRCQFNDCTHVHEPGCAVRQAVEQGDVDPERYQSYLRMRFGELEE